MGQSEMSEPLPGAILALHSASSTGELREKLSSAIRSGALEPGTRIPTIRRIASRTGISAASIASVWSELRDDGLLETRRRGGTFVASPLLQEDRAWMEEDFAGWASVDFVTGHPDPILQPDLREALYASLRSQETNSTRHTVITPELREAAAARWPFEAEDWTTLGGATEAFVLSLAATSQGRGIAVNEPLMPGIRNALERLNEPVFSVASDEDGPIPEDLMRAVALGAGVFAYQPNAAFAHHGTVPPDRLDDLTAVLESADRPVWVVEEDLVETLHEAPSPTLGTRIPDRVLRLHSFCRAFGIDLRTTVVGGPEAALERIRARRSYGYSANSRILQNALAYQLGDTRARAAVDHASRRFERNREELTSALRAHSVEVIAHPGALAVWARVTDETTALIGLAARGVILAPDWKAPGSTTTSQLIRLPILQLPYRRETIDELASQVAETSRSASPLGLG